MKKEEKREINNTYTRFTQCISIAGYLIDPSADPNVFHLVESGDYGRPGETNRAKNAIDRSLSQIKICKAESQALETKLRNEYFTKWDESCDVGEFHGFSRGNLDGLLDKISDKFQATGNDVRTKLKGIQWASEWTYKVYEFTFGSVVDSGTVYFGMIALGKEGSEVEESFDAVTCLYKLDFTVAKVKVEQRRRKRILGINAGTDRRDWYENKNLGFITKKTLTNFCRLKALDAFCKEGLASSVNDVLSIEDVD